jgi:hypothetical protein
MRAVSFCLVAFSDIMKDKLREFLLEAVYRITNCQRLNHSFPEMSVWVSHPYLKADSFSIFIVGDRVSKKE